jgi:hypothetical protein
MEATLTTDLRSRLAIPRQRLDALNDLLLAPDTQVINEFLAVVAKYGTPEEINRKAAQAGSLDALMSRVRAGTPEFAADLAWLEKARDQSAFISIADYRRRVLGERADRMRFNEASAVTLEVSAAQYFSYLIECARQAAAEKTLVPGRFIRVRKMKEQEADGDLAAFQAGVQIIGASIVETLDTRGTDGSNVHLGGPETITGYFGGVGQPNEHALQWIDEYLYYYTTYGVRQVLNVNSGTILLGYLLHRLGVDIEFKISVFVGNDNPYAALWTLLGAKLFSRDDGSSPLIGFNWSNSIDNGTLERSSGLRRGLGFESVVRFEHHITETWKSIVRQPYDRLAELVEIAGRVPNISAKHEGGEPEIEPLRAHPSDILDYFRDKAEVIASGDWEHLRQNFHDKVAATNRTARALTEAGLSFVAATRLHA